MEIIILGCFIYGLLSGWNGSTSRNKKEPDDDSAGDPFYHHMNDQIDF
jgi:hypothetical protein